MHDFVTYLITGQMFKGTFSQTDMIKIKLFIKNE